MVESENNIRESQTIEILKTEYTKLLAISTEIIRVYHLADIPVVFPFSDFEKKLFLLLFPKSDLKWIGCEERDDSDVKTQMTDGEKLIFCSVLFSFKFCSCCQENNKENCDFCIYEDIRFTVNLDGTFTHVQKPFAFTSSFS